jgi:hypothetical protein
MYQGDLFEDLGPAVDAGQAVCTQGGGGTEPLRRR